MREIVLDKLFNVGLPIAAAICTATCTTGGSSYVPGAFDVQATMDRFYDVSRRVSDLDRTHQCKQGWDGYSTPIPPRVAVDMTPGSVLLAPTEAIERPVESRDELDSRSWRGVFAVEYPDEVLFTKRIDIRPDQLDEWRPEPVAGRGHSDHDD